MERWLDGKMVRWLGLASCFLFLVSCSLFADFGGAGAPTADGTYGAAVKYISLQQGTTSSAWMNRGNIAAFAQMTSVGDGTYYCKYNLYPGAVYNYMFFATFGSSTPPTGITGGTTYYDCPRDSGDDAAFFVAVDSNNPTGTRRAGAAYFGAGNDSGDSRRILVVPQDTGYSLSSTSGVWVYNNWSSTGVANVDAIPVSNTSLNVTLGAYTTWGTGESYKSIDIYGGGKWFLYRATDLTGTYGLIASSTSANLGANMTYLDEGLTTGTTYYYIAVTSDAYKGAMNALAADGCLVRQLTGGATGPYAPSYDQPSEISYDDYARPAAAIPVYFKVEAPNWDYIAEHDYIVYLTPVGKDGREWPYKMPGRICRVYLPKT